MVERLASFFTPEKRSRSVTIIAAGIAMLMMLFPPWHAYANGVPVNFGYNFIANAPQLAEIDFGRLFLQIAIVAGLAVGALKLWRA
jgi:F0F1-type ATP synthase membrane subunit c/vacuolar-type H+-ATPase subunit K